MIAKPREDGSRPRTSFMLEKGNYWSNNYMNTASLAALGLICGAGNRPGQVILRGGGHQRGGMGAGGGKGWLSPEKYPGRRKKALNVDRWVMDGKVRFMWTIGLTWFAAMLASQELSSRVADLTVRNPHQPRNVNYDHLVDTLIRRVESGGMVLVDSDIYPVDPLNTQYADIVLPAAGWGEVDFTRCNVERRLRLYAGFNDAPGEARPDWWAISRFARKMGFEGFDWADSNQIFEEAARFSRGGVLNYNALVVHAKREGKTGHEKLREFGTTGIQTPIRVIGGELVGTPKLHDPSNDWGEIEDVTTDQKWLYAFDTHTGKANLLKTPWVNDGWSDFYEAIKPRAEKGEIWITNGRVNEVWQSVWIGGFWVRPDHRGKASNISTVLVFAARLLAAMRWGSHVVFSLTEPMWKNANASARIKNPDIYETVKWWRPQLPEAERERRSEILLVVTEPDVPMRRARAYLCGEDRLRIGPEPEDRQANATPV